MSAGGQTGRQTGSGQFNPLASCQTAHTLSVSPLPVSLFKSFSFVLQLSLSSSVCLSSFLFSSSSFCLSWIDFSQHVCLSCQWRWWWWWCCQIKASVCDTAAPPAGWQQRAQAHLFQSVHAKNLLLLLIIIMTAHSIQQTVSESVGQIKKNWAQLVKLFHKPPNRSVTKNNDYNNIINMEGAR